MRYIFIVGCGRSGTHFLRNILNKHSKIWISGELHYFDRLIHRGVIKATKHLYPFNNEKKIDQLFELLQSGKMFSPFWENPNIQYKKIKKDFLKSQKTYKDLYRIVLDERALSNNKIFGGEKTPLNIFHLKKIFRWFPEAKAIHIIRDPRAIFVSELHKKRNFKVPVNKINFFYSIIIFFYVVIECAIAYRISDSLKKRHTNNFFQVKYSDLVLEQELITKSICNFLNIDFESNMLNTKNVNSSFEKGYDTVNGWKYKIPKIYNMLLTYIFKKRIFQNK